MTPSPRPVRWVLLGALVLCVLVLIGAVGVLAHRRGVEDGAAAGAEAIARVTSTEREIADLRTETASLASARAQSEERARVAWAIADGAAAERDAVLASVRATTPPQARAKRVSAIVRGTLAPSPHNPPKEAPMFHGDPVRPLVLDGVPGMWVEAGAFEQLHAALELRPVLEAEVTALREANAAGSRALELAVRELAVVGQERDVLRIAWAAAEGDAAEARQGSSLPAWVTYGAPAAIVAAVAIGAAVGYAAAPGVTVVR